jgi:hypothetical protein
MRSTWRLPVHRIRAVINILIYLGAARDYNGLQKPYAVRAA